MLFRREEEGKTEGAVGVGGEREGRLLVIRVGRGVVKLTRRLVVGLRRGRLELFLTLLQKEFNHEAPVLLSLVM